MEENGLAAAWALRARAGIPLDEEICGYLGTPVIIVQAEVSEGVAFGFYFGLLCLTLLLRQ